MYPNWQSAITGTGRDSFVPFPVLGVPFPVLGYAISGTVIHWAPYRNWTLCAWSHFRYRAMPFPVRSFLGSVWNWHLCGWSHFWYRALPVPVWSFLGSRNRTGIYVRGPISGTGLCHFRYGHFLGPVLELASRCVVPFPVPGYATFGTVIFRVPYWN
jgi:hypothetical protein